MRPGVTDVVPGVDTGDAASMRVLFARGAAAAAGIELPLSDEALASMGDDELLSRLLDEGRKSEEGPRSLLVWLRVDRQKLRGLLEELAYRAHAAQPKLEGTADIAEKELVDGLLGLAEERDVHPKKLVAYLRDRAGLLIARGNGVYTFVHRTFQEYLAACHLTGQTRPSRSRIPGSSFSAASQSWRCCRHHLRLGHGPRRAGAARQLGSAPRPRRRPRSGTPGHVGQGGGRGCTSC